ncbi:MAG: response regulator [Lachnospiraceae bacterium]|nr:response regulator [Lachnospiraceae bacterium]
MKTLLVVEDEKMIRRGICTIAKRSGVEIEEILECSNGEEALEIVKERKVDVLFTDIRMPKMDGIELVKAINELDEKPVVVAISGYDDFSYAVEMMRNGVKEYILKPVDREKIAGILKKIDDELFDTGRKQKNEYELGKTQLKYLLTNEPASKEELATLKEKYDELFFVSDFVVCCGSINDEATEGENFIRINGVGDSNVYIVEKTYIHDFIENEFPESHLGISKPHSGIENLREAYRQAIEARKLAFCLGETYTFGEVIKEPLEAMVRQASTLLEETASNARLQLIGTGRTDELIRAWDKFFIAVERGYIPEAHFEAAMERFIENAGRMYRTSLVEKDYIALQQFRHTMIFQSVSDYRESFMNWVLKLNESISNRDDMKNSDRKMKQAIAYIKENYNSDINMAVVSNYISMNYSLFSFTFKQYTGQNFVNFLKEIRIEEAKKMLAETDMKVIEISQCVGYDNEKHFMKLFKSTCGVSPTEYRNNMQR